MIIRTAMFAGSLYAIMSKIRPNGEAIKLLAIAEGIAETCHAATVVSDELKHLDLNKFR